MGPDLVVLILTNTDDSYRVGQAVKLVDAKTFAAEFAFDGLDIAVYPGPRALELGLQVQPVENKRCRRLQAISVGL
jgi:hypothetical protein